jgi:hypothetical protein
VRYPEHRLNEVAFRARLYDLNHVPLAKGIRSIVKRVPKVVPYDNDARDADGDGLVQEGTIWERPAGTRFISKLGSALTSGLRAIPSNSKIVDADGNDVDYKPGDKAQGGRAKLRGLLARRRLRRAGRRRERAGRRRDEDAERVAPDSFDKLIETLENAANAASQERLIEAEKARGDGPMNAEYRTFWDQFLETFTGINQRQHKNPRDKARSKSAIRKALGMEGNRRTAGDENGNAPDRDREREFDEEALDGKGVMPSAIEEHHRKLDEDPEYRKRWNRALREGRVDQFIEKEGLRPKLPDPEEGRPGGRRPPGGGRLPELPSPDRRPRGPRWPRLPGGGRRPRPRIGEERVDVNGVAWVYDGPAEWVPHKGRGTGEGGYWKNGWRRKDQMRPPGAPEVPPVYTPADEVDAPEVPEADAPEAGKPGLGRMTDDELQARIDELIDINDDMATDDLTPGQQTLLESLEFERDRRLLVDGDLSDEVVESIEHYRDTVLPELDDEELAQELAELRDSLTGSGEGREFPNNDGAERFALALQEQRRRLVEGRDAPEVDAPDEAEEREEFTPWDDDTLANSSNEEIGRRITELVAMDPIGRDRESAIGTELERLMQEDRRRSEARESEREQNERDWSEALDERQAEEDAEEDLPGDQFYDNTDWIDGSDPWNDDAIDAAIQVALATDDTGVIEGIERSLQWFKDDMTASEWRGAKGRRHREIQEMLDLNRTLDRRRRERAGAAGDGAETVTDPNFQRGADDEAAQGRSLLNNLDDWDDQKLALARNLAYRLSRTEGNDPESREKRELALLLQHRIDNDGRDRTGMWQVGVPHTPEGDVPEGDVPEGDAPEADVPEGDAPESRVPGGLVEDLSDEELNAEIDELENIDIEDLSPMEARRLDALGDEYDRRFGTEAEQDQDIEDRDLEERLEWYETDPASLSDEELQTEINELNSEEDLDEHAMEWLTKLSNEDDRRQEARNEQEDQEAAEAETGEEARRTELIEEQRDPRDMSADEMAEEMNAINGADDDELEEHWGSPEAAMDRYNALEDALGEQEERDASDARDAEREDRVADQGDPTDMSDEDIGEEMSELFEITQDEDYTEEAQEEAQDRWNLLSAEQDRRESETEQNERDWQEALDGQQAEEDAEEDRIREAEEQEAEAAAEAEATREAQIEADERQIRVDEHDGNPPSDLSEDDLANEIAELSDSEIMDDIDRERLTDLENEVERRMEVAATREDENRGERSRSLRARSVESLDEELQELLDDPDSDEDRINAIDMELKRRKQRKNRDNRRRTNRRTDELEADEEGYEGEGEGGEEGFVVPDRGSDDDGLVEGEEGGEALDPYAQMEQDLGDDEPEPSPQPVSAETEEPTGSIGPERIAPRSATVEEWIEEYGGYDPQFAHMDYGEVMDDLYENYTNRGLTPEEVERAMALSEELTRRRAHPRHQGGSGPDGEWTDADEAADPGSDPYATLEDFLGEVDYTIFEYLRNRVEMSQAQILAQIQRREGLLGREDEGHRSVIGVHREMLRDASDEEILRLLDEVDLWDPTPAREEGIDGPGSAHYENNQKALNVIAEGFERGMIPDDGLHFDPEREDAERDDARQQRIADENALIQDRHGEASLTDPLEGKTPAEAEADAEMRRDWDSYSPEEKQYLVHSFVDARLRETRAALIDQYVKHGLATLPDLPEDASPEMRELRAKQLEIEAAKLPLYEVMADWALSGWQPGNHIQGANTTPPNTGQTGHNRLPLELIHNLRTFNELGDDDLRLHMEALGFDLQDDRSDRSFGGRLAHEFLTAARERQEAIGNIVNDEKMMEKVAEFELMTADLGEGITGEVLRRVEAAGPPATFEGSADAVFKDLLKDLYGGDKPPQNWDEFNEKRVAFLTDASSVAPYLAHMVHNGYRDRDNIKRAFGVLADGLIDDLGLSEELNSSLYSRNSLSDPTALTRRVIEAWTRQLRRGEIDEATFTQNVKNLPTEMRNSFQKHTQAAHVEGRQGTNSRIGRKALDALFGSDGDGQGELGRIDILGRLAEIDQPADDLFGPDFDPYKRAVEAGLIQNADTIKELASDGLIDVYVGPNEQRIIHDLMKKLRQITDAESLNLRVGPDGGSVKMWENDSSIDANGRLKRPTTALTVEEQKLYEKSVIEAMGLFPDDWVMISNALGEVSLVKTDKEGRASYSDGSGMSASARDLPAGMDIPSHINEIYRPLGYGQIDISTEADNFSVADAGHESIHRAQSILTLLIFLDEAKARRLTTPDPSLGDNPADPIWQATPLGQLMGVRNMDPSEIGIPDHLSLPYMTKGYSSRGGQLRWEITAVGMELLLGGKLTAGYRGRNKDLGAYTLADALAEEGTRGAWLGHVLAMMAII